MDVNYEYYRIFYYAAKYKSLTRAAQVLHSSQPNVSRAVRLLESETGCSLFVRSNRGISLTPEGERLYMHVKIAVEQFQAAEEEIAEAVNMQNGRVTIGASETALRMVLLPALRIFKKSYPEVRIRILNHLTLQAVESVRDGRADFAVVAIPPKIERPLTSYPITWFKDILAGGPSCFGFGERMQSLKEMESYPLISLGENTMTYKFYEKFYQEHGFKLKPELQAATTDQILPMIKNDLGIGFLPEIFADEALNKREICKISLVEEIPSRQICFVENEDHPLSIAAKELKALLMQYNDIR